MGILGIPTRENKGNKELTELSLRSCHIDKKTCDNIYRPYSAPELFATGDLSERQ